MKIGDNVYVHGYIDEIRNDTVIIRNNGGYFGTVPSEIISGELPQRMRRRWIPVEQDLPKDCVTVWVTIRGHMVRAEGGFYVADEKSWYNENGFPMMVQPVAWMPMEVPEPWRGKEHEL